MVRWALDQLEMWITTFYPPHLVFSVWGWIYLVSQVSGSLGWRKWERLVFSLALSVSGALRGGGRERHL